MLVILPLKTPMILTTTVIMANITVINHAQPLPVNKPQARPNHARPNAIATEETIYTTFIIALVNTVPNCGLRSSVLVRFDKSLLTNEDIIVGTMRMEATPPTKRTTPLIIERIVTVVRAAGRLFSILI
jgi:hypothetical protein